MRIQLATLSLLLAAGTVSATEVHRLSADCERALALGAAPAYLRAQAGVYVLGEAGYELVKPSGNGYLCLVERNHERSLIPQCFDPAARDAQVALILDEGRLIRQGASFAELRKRRKKALAEGEYPSASGPGVVYMISDYNYVYSPRSRRHLKVAPHVMYHAPHLTNDDIGAHPRKALANPGVPFIANQGPHGYMISFTREASDSTDVRRHCEGQLPPVDDYRPFP